MLAQRLDKLETDLQLLISTHDLFLQSDTESLIDADDNPLPTTISSFPSKIYRHNHTCNDDVPERDSASTSDTKKTKIKSKKSLEIDKHRPEMISQKNDAVTTTSTVDINKQNKDIIQLQDLLENERILRKDLEVERTTLQEELGREKTIRKETEDSAKQVYIQLQKLEEDLHREKEMKKDLLLESLQLKNKLDGSYTEAVRLQTDSTNLKQEVERLEGKISVVSREKANLVQRLIYVCQDLGFLSRDNNFSSKCAGRYFRSEGEEDPEVYMEILKDNFQHMIKRLNRSEQDGDGGQEQIRKLTSQLNTLVGRCATLEKERDLIKSQLIDANDRESHLKTQLHMCQLTVTSAESDLLKKQIEYECALQKLSSSLQLSDEKHTQKMEEYSKLIRRSKELLLNLRQERDQTRVSLHEAISTKFEMEQKVKMLTCERQRWSLEEEQLKKRLEESREENLNNVKSWQIEKLGMEGTLRKYTGERRKLLDMMNEMKHSLVKMKTKVEYDSSHFAIEKEKVLSEKMRLEENLMVLKKVSEDQGQTIGKLRGEVESLKSMNFKLDGDLREFQSRENQLIRRLEKEEKQSDRYLSLIDELEERIQKFTEELRAHNCTDFADTKYKRRVEELEGSLEEKTEQWKIKMTELSREREEAINRSETILEKMEEMKKAHDKIIKEMKDRLKEEIQRVNEIWRNREDERLKKISSLQSELDRQGSSSSQLQRALSSKIKQLQAALSICLGGSGGGGGSTNPHLHQHNHNPNIPNSMFSFPSHQQIHHPPVAASGNSNGFYVDPNSSPNLLNIDGGHQHQKNQSHTCFTFSAGGYEGNQNPTNPSPPTTFCCTSAPNPSQPCTTATAPVFDLDFMETLIL